MNEQESPCGQADFECTQKCIDELSKGASSELKTRARQFCLLLNREDSVSLQLRDQLQNKVDIERLVDEGFLRLNSFNHESASALMSNEPTVAMHLEQRSAFFEHSANRSISRSDVMSDIDAPTNESKQDDVQVSPLLQFVAGEFKA